MCHANRTKIKHHNLLQQCRTIHTSCPPGTRPSSKPFCIQYILSWWAGCPRANDDCASLTWGFDLAHTTPSRSSRSMPTPDSRNAHSTRKLFRHTQKINNFEISIKKKFFFFTFTSNWEVFIKAFAANVAKFSFEMSGLRPAMRHWILKL